MLQLNEYFKRKVPLKKGNYVKKALFLIPSNHVKDNSYYRINKILTILKKNKTNYLPLQFSPLSHRSYPRNNSIYNYIDSDILKESKKEAKKLKTKKHYFNFGRSK